MKPARIVLGAAAVVLTGCATANPPGELVSARQAYADARVDAVERAPVEVHEAGQILARAESAWKHGDDDVARDLAYVAERTSELALVRAQNRLLEEQGEAGERALLDRSEEARRRAAERLEAERDRAQMTAAELERERAALENERRLAEERAAQLEQERLQREAQSAELEAERQARADAEAKLSETMRRLDEIANVREDPEEIVIVLPGEVLFASGKATLTSTARDKLQRVVDAVVAQGEGAIRIEGHTDSQGSTELNDRLSQARAEAVRDFLVDAGVARDRISAIGRGELEPLVDNNTAENRAVNRRVEITVEKSASPRG